MNKPPLTVVLTLRPTITITDCFFFIPIEKGITLANIMAGLNLNNGLPLIRSHVTNYDIVDSYNKLNSKKKMTEKDILDLFNSLTREKAKHFHFNSFQSGKEYVTVALTGLRDAVQMMARHGTNATLSAEQASTIIACAKMVCYGRDSLISFRKVPGWKD